MTLFAAGIGYPQIPFWLSAVFMLVGLAAIAWSSDVFVAGAASLAKALGISPLVIGMVVIGFGTSAPELCVSVMSGLSGHANLSLGNAYGSCVFNIAVILGVAAMIMPLVVRPTVALVAGPGLAAISAVSYLIMCDGTCSRIGASILLFLFALLMPLYCWFDQKTKPAAPAAQTEASGDSGSDAGMLALTLKVVAGLVGLVGSSHILVWGAVDFAREIGVSDLVIGLTIVAIGTSLPELASAIASARRGENEFVLGNIIGSNLFNTLAVVGLATFIQPLVPGSDGSAAFSPYVLGRDIPFMAVLSFSILVFGLNWRNWRTPGVVTRWKGALWILSFAAYTALAMLQELKLQGV